MRAQDDEHYIKLVTDFIKKFGKATREDIDKLLSGKLSDALDDSKKVKKIGNKKLMIFHKNILQKNIKRFQEMT